MRTPTVMIIGLVLAPCGLVLNLTCTCAPNWRVVTSLSNKPVDFEEDQGIWDICQVQPTQSTLTGRQCGITNDPYFAQVQVKVAQALMIASMAVTALGLALASLGVRCWAEEPNYTVAGLGGLVIFASGVLSLIPISWYNFLLNSLEGQYGSTGATSATQSVGYCLVLGYIGSCFEIIAGFSLALSLVHSCQECWRARGRGSPAAKYYSNKGPGIEAPNDPRRPEDPGAYWRRTTGDPWHRDSVSTVPRSYTNPMDATAGELPPQRGSARPGSKLSSLACDSDLL